MTPAITTMQPEEPRLCVCSQNDIEHPWASRIELELSHDGCMCLIHPLPFASGHAIFLNHARKNMHGTGLNRGFFSDLGSCARHARRETGDGGKGCIQDKIMSKRRT